MENNHNKHFITMDRMTIASGLQQNYSLVKIADMIGKDPTAISREIKRHLILIPRAAKPRELAQFCTMFCINRFECKTKHLCGKTGCEKECKHCRIDCGIVEKCPKLEYYACKRLSRFPHCCNGCPKLRTTTKCGWEQRIYDPLHANNEAKRILAESRTGIRTTEAHHQEMELLLQEATRKGRSVAVTYQQNPEVFQDYTIQRIYQMIDAKILDISFMDMPQKVRRKPCARNGKRKQETDRGTKRVIENAGRAYPDFKLHTLACNPNTIVELDTVIGTKDSKKVMMTMIFRSTGLLIIRLLEKKTPQCITEEFQKLRETLGLDLYSELFETILTDRGTEFIGAIDTIEGNPETGESFSKLFFCDPQQSGQKGLLEETHTLLRRKFPKKRNFERFTQSDCDLAASHINSYLRGSLGYRCSYDLFERVHGSNALELLNIRFIHPNEVDMNII